MKKLENVKNIYKNKKYNVVVEEWCKKYCEKGGKELQNSRDSDTC